MDSKFTLDSEQVYALVAENSYKIDQLTRFRSRCIDGRYENSPSLPALAISGADAGELAVVYAAAYQYGFEVDKEKVLETVQELVGKKNVAMHTDEHGESTQPAANCGHIKQIRADSAAYGLSSEYVDILNEQLEKIKNQEGQEVVLKGEHKESAVLLVEGGYGILPQYMLELNGGQRLVQVFVFHQTLVNERHRELAKLLIKNKAVTLYDDLDEEYLYEVLSSVTEDHLFETAKRLAAGLPLYLVTFKDDGSFKLKNQGLIEE